MAARPLWPHQRAYRADADRFLRFVARPLRHVRLGDIHAFADSLGSLSPNSQARTLAAAKSLLALGHRVGYLPLNVGAAIRLPARKDTLNERILDEPDVRLLLRSASNPRNHALLVLLYGGGLRVAEAASLCWRDLAPRMVGGQCTLFGKGARKRSVLRPASVFEPLLALRGDAPLEAPVFAGRGGDRPLDVSAIRRIVYAAARRACLEPRVSAHWLRHAHATHALEHQAPIHLVQATLGHASVATTGRYTHARPTESSATYVDLKQTGARNGIHSQHMLANRCRMCALRPEAPLPPVAYCGRASSRRRVLPGSVLPVMGPQAAWCTLRSGRRVLPPTLAGALRRSP